MMRHTLTPSVLRSAVTRSMADNYFETQSAIQLP